LVIGFLTSNLHGSLRLGDYKLENHDEAGLPLPTRFRAKFATISGDIVTKKLGSLTTADRVAISECIHVVLALV
jgi:hypothetical protein